MLSKSRLSGAVLAVFLVLLLALPATIMAESSPLWGSLSPGPYDVGFETVEKYDYSRTFRDKYDYDGQSRPGETARPIQICIWYPAVRHTDDLPMLYAEYAFPAPLDASFYGILSQLQGREINYLAASLNTTGAVILNVMNAGLVAVRDAGHADGTFPLIIYCPDAGGGLSENAIMCEYLASHGFIVASSHAIGPAGIMVGTSFADLESMVRDREFVFAHMRDYAGVDNSKPAVLGYGVGAVAAMIMQMRNTDIEAVAALNPAFLYTTGAELLTANSFFSIESMHVPLLLAYISGHEDLDLSVADSMKYADRFLLGMKEYNHNDFSQYALTGALYVDTTSANVEPSAKRYHSVCRSVLTFFNAVIKADAAAREFFADPTSQLAAESPVMTARVLERQIPPPTQIQFTELIEDDKIDRAVEIYQALRAGNPEYVPFAEAAMNALGYQLLGQNRTQQAAKIFRINTEAFPYSANVWDSYADACIASGDTETAIKCYETVLQVLPADSVATPQIREILQNNATTYLEEHKK